MIHELSHRAMATCQRAALHSKSCLLNAQGGLFALVMALAPEGMERMLGE
jgi:hypothetical protein